MKPIPGIALVFSSLVLALVMICIAFSYYPVASTMISLGLMLGLFLLLSRYVYTMILLGLNVGVNTVVIIGSIIVCVLYVKYIIDINRLYRQ